MEMKDGDSCGHDLSRSAKVIFFILNSKVMVIHHSFTTLLIITRKPLPFIDTGSSEELQFKLDWIGKV